jgi:DNA replication and repair protein RecF
MNLHRLQLTTFRNYHSLHFVFPEEGAIFEGINGSGKTNILEAIYILCTGRSQRGSKRSEMINFGSDNAYIEGEFKDGDRSAVASMGFSRDKKVVMKYEGVVVKKFTEWFGKRPVISFGTDDLQLVSGSPELRRRFIDILCSQIDSEYLKSLITYKHFLSCRNQILSSNFDKIQCEIYEEQMAHSGADIFIKRKEIISYLGPFLESYYREISGDRESAGLLYEPSVSCECSSKNEWKNVFYELLKERRSRDIETGFSTVGPHRDDIRFLLNQKPSKIYGSQGQCRSIVLSLKLSSVSCLEYFRQDRMIFLIDDALSELDQDRTSRVLPLIENKGQVFIATPVFNSSIKKSLLRCKVKDGTVNVE